MKRQKTKVILSQRVYASSRTIITSEASHSIQAKCNANITSLFCISLSLEMHEGAVWRHLGRCQYCTPE